MELIPKYTYRRKLSNMSINGLFFHALSNPEILYMTVERKKYIEKELEKHHKKKLTDEV